MHPAIQTPFKLIPFSVMSKFEAKEYFEWFVSIAPQRNEILQKIY
jgi:hypothetical protein